MRPYFCNNVNGGTSWWFNYFKSEYIQANYPSNPSFLDSLKSGWLYGYTDGSN